jgi:hypothetical protein
VTSLRGTIIRFLPDGYAVAYMLEGEVRSIDSKFLLEVPVILYDEEWQWLNSGVIYLGLEENHTSTVVEEVEHWLKGGARTAHTPTPAT